MRNVAPQGAFFMEDEEMDLSTGYIERLKNSENAQKNPRIHDPKKNKGGFDPTVGYGYSINEANRSLKKVNADFEKAKIPPLSPTEWRSIQRGEYHRVDLVLSEPQMNALLKNTVEEFQSSMKTAAAAHGVDVESLPPAIQEAAFDQWYNGKGGLVFGDKTRNSNEALRQGDYGRFLGEVLLDSNKNQDYGLYERRIRTVNNALANLDGEDGQKAMKQLGAYIAANSDKVSKLENVYRNAGKAVPDVSRIGTNGGSVPVKGYDREGHRVPAHTRSAPDGDVTNNLSYKGK